MGVPAVYAKKEPGLAGIEIKIFPNPSHGSFEVRANGLIEFIEIYDLQGKMVYERSPYTKIAEIDLDAAVALYIVKISVGGEIFHSRIYVK